MNATLGLVVVMAVLYACGVYSMLDKSLMRILVGFMLIGNATNLLIFLMSGGFGSAPLVGYDGSAEGVSDPLPQALVLTAIVINFGITGFLLALIYRSWWLRRVDRDTSDESIVAGAESHDDDEAEAEEVLYQALDDDEAVQESLEASNEPEDDDEDESDDEADGDGPEADEPEHGAERPDGEARPGPAEGDPGGSERDTAGRHAAAPPRPHDADEGSSR